MIQPAQAAEQTQRPAEGRAPTVGAADGQLAEVEIEQVGGRVDLGDLPVIDADPTQMRQLLQNLISNALKFHRPGEPPTVQVNGVVVNGHGDELYEDTSGIPLCRITVQDNGIGFDEKYLDRIFQVFQRLHGRSDYEGTAIGLATSRKIIERHPQAGYDMLAGSPYLQEGIRIVLGHQAKWDGTGYPLLAQGRQ